MCFERPQVCPVQAGATPLPVLLTVCPDLTPTVIHYHRLSGHLSSVLVELTPSSETWLTKAHTSRTRPPSCFQVPLNVRAVTGKCPSRSLVSRGLGGSSRNAEGKIRVSFLCLRRAVSAHCLRDRWQRCPGPGLVDSSSRGSQPVCSDTCELGHQESATSAECPGSRPDTGVGVRAVYSGEHGNPGRDGPKECSSTTWPVAGWRSVP